MKNKTALLFGSTGLVGGSLLGLLLADPRYEKVKVFVRRKAEFPADPKLEVHEVDLASTGKYAGLLKGDDLFCCLGTTIGKAGSKEAFRKVDLEIPVMIAEAALRNGVSTFTVVSSLGASSRSSNFYLRTKGEMEDKVLKFPFKRIAILQPSLLLGDRKEFRFGEQAAKFLMQAFSFIFVGSSKKYKAIHVEAVAKAMIRIANGNYQETVFESDRIQEIADKND